MPSPSEQARLGVLDHAMAQQAERDFSVGDIALRALAAFSSQKEAEALLALGPDAMAEQGWTKADLNVAIHCLAGKNEQPAALAMSHERSIVRQRARLAQVGVDVPEAQGYVIPVPQGRMLGTNAKLIGPTFDVADEREDED